MAWGTYMLRKPLLSVPIRLRVKARHHGKLLFKLATKLRKRFYKYQSLILLFLHQ
jgi:hypothetical protein